MCDLNCELRMSTKVDAQVTWGSEGREDEHESEKRCEKRRDEEQDGGDSCCGTRMVLRECSGIKGAAGRTGSQGSQREAKGSEETRQGPTPCNFQHTLSSSSSLLPSCPGSNYLRQQKHNMLLTTSFL